MDNPKQPLMQTEEFQFDLARRRMVQSQIRSRDVTDERVLAAIERVPRHRFVPSNWQAQAYDDRPLPIGLDQTISQPYVVALMTQLARPTPTARALDIGTGSGYQAAVLAELCAEVYSIEIHQPLADAAQQRLAELGYTNVHVRCGDARLGWPEAAPFDLMIAAAAPTDIPESLIDQLRPSGRLVIPVGGRASQDLMVIEKRPDGEIVTTNYGGVAFVPMTGHDPR